MLSHYDVPYHNEEYSVPSRRLSDGELDSAAWRVASNAQQVYADDPGIWKTFAEFLAFRIGAESVQYVYGGDWRTAREEMERFALAVQKHAS